MKRVFHLPTTLLALIVLLLFGGAFGREASAVIIDQPMTGTTAPGWVFGGAQGLPPQPTFSAYLTAAQGVDSPGNGWLRLTNAASDQAGYAYFNTSFDISQGAVISYDYATWGGNGADGYSIFLFDASASPFNVGASGGSLGYAQKTTAGGAPANVPGLSGGYIGIGIDEFGNFSNPTEGRVGGPGSRPNAVAVRGPASSSYAYIGGSPANVGTLWFNQGTRPVQTGNQFRKVVIQLRPQASPIYLTADIYIQYGFGQPLTLVASAPIGSQPPGAVKVGFAASTGGQTNIHEIRNLLINNVSTASNLAITKTASSPTVSPGGDLTYTVTARNYGPNPLTATNVPITDTVPPQLTGVTWTCAGAGGGICGGTSGSGNSISTTATLPFNATVTYTITGTVPSDTSLLGTEIVNTASLAAPPGVTDYNPNDDSDSVTVTVTGPPVSISGNVFHDNGSGSGGIAYDGIRNGSEPLVSRSNSGGTTYYAKIYRASDLTTALQAATVSSSGSFTFSNIPSYETYTIILSTNSTLTAFNPSFPSTAWIYTAPVNYTLTDVEVAGSNLSNQNFGLYNGFRIDGKVLRDDGAGGVPADANNGMQNASEAGIAGVTVSLRNNNGTTTHTSTTTDSGGNFTLFYTNLSSRTLRIYETNPADHVSVNFNPGNTNGSYTIGNDYIQFAYTQYNDHSGVIFSDVPLGAFTPATQTAGGSALAPVWYAHTFTPGSGGSVAFTTRSRSQGSWPAIEYYRDTNCDGAYDAGDSLIAGAIATSAGTDVCLLVKETIPASAGNGATDAVVTRATFTYTNSIGPQTSTHDVTDTTTVIAADLSTSTKTWQDLNGGDQNPGDVLRYTITLNNTSSLPAAGISVSDDIPANISGFTVISIPDGATDSSTGAGGANGTGYLNISNITVPADGSATVVFAVTIVGGTPTGTTIDNCATVTNPAGAGAAPCANTITVSASQVPQSGNKRLYLYPTSNTAGNLSRTVQTNGTSYYINRGDAANRYMQLTLNPELSAPLNVDGDIGVRLCMRRTTNNSGVKTVRVQLLNNATAIGTYDEVDWNANGWAWRTFSIPHTGTATLDAGDPLRLRITNMGSSSTSANNRVDLDPDGSSCGGTNPPSYVEINTATVINVDSIDFYNAAWPGGSPIASATPGAPLSIRAKVSDPFGHADITAARITIIDPNGTPIGTLPMTELAGAAGAEKTYELLINPVPLDTPTGYWTVRVEADEGTEGTVRDDLVKTLPVAAPPPNLTVLKSASGSTASPGTVITYEVQVHNTGAGAATNVVLSDRMSPYTAWSLDFGAGQPFWFDPGSSGLAGFGTPDYSRDGGTTWGQTPASGGGGAPAGYDGTISNWRIPMTGAMNAGGSFTLRYKVLVK